VVEKATSLGWGGAESGTSVIANLSFLVISLALLDTMVDRAEVLAAWTGVFLMILRGLTAARVVGRIKVDGGP
jgi:hypothetical protein